MSLWNTVYLQKAYDYYLKKQSEIKKYVAYTSPIVWNHINLLGEYKIDLSPKLSGLRDLNLDNYFS